MNSSIYSNQVIKNYGEIESFLNNDWFKWSESNWKNKFNVRPLIGTTSFIQLSIIQPSVPRIGTNTNHSMEIYM